MANHDMKDSIKEVVKYINDNIALPEVDEELIDSKVDTHSEQVITDVGGVHGLKLDETGTPTLKYKKGDGTWGAISLGATTFSNQDIADIKAAFDRGLNGTSNP